MRYSRTGTVVSELLSYKVIGVFFFLSIIIQSFSTFKNEILNLFICSTALAIDGHNLACVAEQNLVNYRIKQVSQQHGDNLKNASIL